jgi:predicted ATPase
MSSTESSFRPWLLGREREVAFLRSALVEAAAGTGATIVLVGDAGLGKTRLAEECASLGTAAGYRVLWGHYHEESGGPPYRGWMQLLRALPEETGSDSPIEVADLLRAGSGDITAPSHAASLEAARFGLFDAVCGILRRAAEDAPLLLVLEDLHWADRSSLRLLEFA